MYELFKGAEEDCFVMIEWWADTAAIEAHMKTPHVQQGRESKIHLASFVYLWEL